MMNIRLLLAVLAFVYSAELLSAEAKYIDRRNRSETTVYEIHFCSRPSPGFFGKPGHTYVAFYKAETGAENISFRAFGATSSSISEIFGGDGFLEPEYASHLRQDCLVVQVNSDVYETAWSAASPLFMKPEYSYWNYHITDSSCVDYSRRVAHSISLNVNDNETPASFITKLKEDNG